jgi:hypothetical protein
LITPSPGSKPKIKHSAASSSTRHPESIGMQLYWLHL